MNAIVKKPSILFLCLLISFGTVCAVLFTPALPEIGLFFNVSQSTAQWSMTVYLIGYALGQLPYGPLANYYGKKNALIIGVSIALIGLLLCVVSYFTHYFYIFLFGRLITAFGACVGLMMAFTLLNTFYNGKEARQYSSYLMLAFAIIPGLSVSIGGIMSHAFNWIACFYFLILYALSIRIFVGYQVQTCDAQPILFSFKHDAVQLLRQIKDPKILLSATLIGGCTAALYTFSTLAPFISIHLLKLSETQFGYYNLIPSFGMLLGALISAQTSKKCSITENIGIGIINFIIASCLMLIAMVIKPLPFNLFIMMAYVNFSLTFIISNASVLALENAKDKANASSMMSFINLSIGALGIGLIQKITLEIVTLPLIMLAIATILGGLGLIAYLLSGAQIPRQA